MTLCCLLGDCCSAETIFSCCDIVSACEEAEFVVDVHGKSGDACTTARWAIARLHLVCVRCCEIVLHTEKNIHESCPLMHMSYLAMHCHSHVPT
jgi:hypothetical protein